MAGRSYACGRQARETLAKLASAGTVSCSGWERDRYGRVLARCEVEGRDLGQTMVEMGWAVSYGDYAVEEAAARHARKGLWAGRFQTPSDWRQQQKAPQETRHDWLGLVFNFLKQIAGMV